MSHCVKLKCVPTRVKRRRLISSSCQTGNCSIHESPEQVYDFLSVDKHTLAHTNALTCTHARAHTHTFRFVHTYTQVARHQSGPVVMSFHLSFIFILQFHHSLASCALSPLASILPSLSFPALLFFIISPSLRYSVSHSSSLLFFLSLSLSYQPTLTRSVSLPQASCVYISVVYFYKCQTVFLPSVY